MQIDTESKEDTTDFSFQVALLHLNLHLGESETAPAPQKRAHEAALAEMHMLVGR
jgi:hypothetical protein